MAEKKIVASVDVGKPKTLSEKHTICFKFHDFANLTQKRGGRVVSPSLPCHGCKWRCYIYPNGSNTSGKDETHVSIYLACFLKASDVDVVLSLQAGPKRVKFHEKAFTATFMCGLDDFVKRADVLDPDKNYLVDGTLTVEATIQIGHDKPETWSPPKTFHRDIGRLFESSKRLSDVTFLVGGRQFQAHRLLLESLAPTLSGIAENVPNGEEIEINDVEPTIFDIFLDFVYKGGLPKDCDIDKNAIPLLTLADKYGCTSLKLVAEAEVAASHINIESVIDMLLLADSKNCALLKERAISFFVANKEAMIKTEGYSKIQESPKLLNELMKALLNPDKIHNDVSTLRRKLYDAGLEVDGTREMLVKRLKESFGSINMGDID